MNHSAITDRLNLPPATVLQLIHLDIELWGQTLCFSGIACQQSFQIRLTDCREVRWQHYAHMDAPDRPAFPPTEIVDFHLGKDQHRQPLQLLTDHFGLTVSYGALQIEKIVTDAD